LQDEPSAQVISYKGNRIPSFLRNGIMTNHNSSVGHKYTHEDRSNEDQWQVAEATISRKAECIVITWCSTFIFKALEVDRFGADPPTVRLCVYRGGELVVDSKIPLHKAYVDDSNILGIQEIVCCVTLRRKHPVVEAVKPGDRLRVFINYVDYHVLSIYTSEANVCIVYNGGGHLLLEVNSELLSKDASRELEEQFGELVLEDESRKESRQNPDNIREKKRFPTRKRSTIYLEPDVETSRYVVRSRRGRSMSN
jgi:hypothetical protein